MLWASSTKAAFGMIKQTSDDKVWIVGYYCFDSPNVGPNRDISIVKKNVGRHCFVDGYNDCYNQRALNRHNEMREGHAGYIPLELDKDIAKSIQASLLSTAFNGAISATDKGKYSTCGENIFVLTDQSKRGQVPLTNMASDFWYGGNLFWDYKAGTPKTGSKASQTLQANNFA